MGARWVKGSHNISILFGSYEKVQSLEFFKRATGVRVFWDLGAHVGYYSLLFKKANPSGKMFSFEPVIRNTQLFEKHMILNRIDNYQLFNVAVSDHEGNLCFRRSQTNVAGKLSDDGEVVVKVIKLSDWLHQDSIEIPQLIKIDIEGEEHKVLQDIKAFLAVHKPVIFLSTHGDQVHRACISLLQEIGYSFKPLDSSHLSTCQEMLVYQ